MRACLAILGILRRKAPHAVLSWRYFFPGQGPEVRLHRKVFLGAWPGLPRAAWVLIAIYSYLPWYLWRGWRQAFSAWRRESPEVCALDAVPPLRQLFDVLALALGHGTPPVFYYRYSLHRLPEAEWLRFVFTHELPHWHQLMSPRIGSRSRRLLAHKHDFAVELARLGLPCVETILVLRRGESIPYPRLFRRESLFLKPEDGSRKQGCSVLRYDPIGDRYSLAGFDGAEGDGEIPARLENLMAGRDYLVQPLLRNHSSLREAWPVDSLMTIRLVTVFVDGLGKVLRANLEVPLEEGSNRVVPMPIDSAEGTVTLPQGGFGTGLPLWPAGLERLEGLRIQFWPEVREAAERAHGEFPDVSAIGWDLAITETGVKILEGNFNWGVAAHQLDGRPLIPDWMAATDADVTAAQAAASIPTGALRPAPR